MPLVSHIGKNHGEELRWGRAATFGVVVAVVAVGNNLDGGKFRDIAIVSTHN